MKVIYTDEALRDLDEILEFIELHYPAISEAFEERLRAIEQRIASWPKSAEEVAQRPGVRVVPFTSITVLGRSRGSLTIRHERRMAFCAPHPIMTMPVHY
jgi:plasmid stabilization system protein ParE